MERSSFDSHWRELGDYILPRRTRFTASDRNRGDKRNQNIIDSTAKFAATTLRSGLHAGLTSPARPWMRLTTPDPDMAEFGPVKVWLHTVTQRMLTLFIQSNLYNVLPVVYGDMGVFGTAAMAVLEDEQEVFRCYPFPVGSYAIGLDSRQVAGTFLREYSLTVRQVVEEFGLQPNGTIDWTPISSSVKSLWEQGSFDAAIDVCWLVLPNEEANPRRLGSRFMKWSSLHFETGTQGTDRAVNLERDKFLRVSGFNEFPFMVPRWEITGEDSYGTDCPGMTALGDVKQLQIMQRKKGQALAKMVDPPLQGPSSLMTQKTSLLPGDITYVDVRDGVSGLKPIHEVSLPYAAIVEDIREVQFRIRRAFYEDLFLMLAQSEQTQPVTAREIEERHEEKLLALGPVLERTNDELLDPLIDRVFNIMLRKGLVPQAPPELEGVDLKVEYISVMAQAQRLVGLTGQDRFMTTMLGLIEQFPETRYKIDTNRVVDNYGEILGIDPRIVRPTEEATALLDADRQAQAQAAQAAQAKDMSTALKNAGTTPMDEDTALTRLVQGVTG